jgi:hypothetical protein
LLVAIDAEVGILTLACESIDFIHTGCIVEAWLRQAVVRIHVAGGALETWQTKAGRRQVSVPALGCVLTQHLPVYNTIVDARSAQLSFPAACAIAGERVERVCARGVVFARNEFALVNVNLTQFARKTWHTRARKAIRVVYAGGTVDARAAVALVTVYGAQGS